AGSSRARRLATTSTRSGPGASALSRLNSGRPAPVQTPPLSWLRQRAAGPTKTRAGRTDIGSSSSSPRGARSEATASACLTTLSPIPWESAPARRACRCAPITHTELGVTTRWSIVVRRDGRARSWRTTISGPAIPGSRRPSPTSRRAAAVEGGDFGTGDPGQAPPEPDRAAGGSSGGAPGTARGPARGFAEDVVGVAGGALETLDLPVDDGCHLCLVPHAASAVAAFEPRPCAVRSCWRPAREAPHLTAGRQIVRSPSGGHPAPAGRARAVPAEPDHPRFGLHPMALRASGTFSSIGATDGTREGFDRWRAGRSS